MPFPPDPAEDEVLVRVRAVGICGTDLHWYLEGGVGNYPSVYPQVLGHEPAGEIVGVGRRVEGLKPGQKVAIEPAITCGHCEFCMSGRHNNCSASVFMSTPQMPGLFREFAVMPAHNVMPLPDHMSFSRATIIEPLAVILHVLELVDIHVGDTVAVMGAGPIGLLTTAVARLAGAARIFVTDKVPHRLRIAEEMGADTAVETAGGRFVEAVLDQTRGRGVDIVIDAAGSPETINASIGVARAGGRVVLIGLPSENHVTIDILAAMGKELNIQTIKRSNHNGHAALDLLESGRISDRLVTHHFALEETPRAFDVLSNYSDNVGKVIIEMA
jgi:L-iditol 2-dehydrogenase